MPANSPRSRRRPPRQAAPRPSLLSAGPLALAAGVRPERPARKPSYGSATRLARLVLGLAQRPYGWSFDAIQDELGISERTLLRYLAACRRGLVDEEEKPLVETIRRGTTRLVRLAPRAPGVECTTYELLFLYLALTVLHFLDGTVIRDGVAGLWERMERTLPGAQRLRLADFGRKFYTVPFAAKTYRRCDAILDTLIQCLVYQYRTRIRYGGVLGEGKVHEFDPYTLAVYRGGLYVLGYSHLYRKIIWLAVERMCSVEKLPVRFEYPQKYAPQKYTDGMFGIIDGPTVEVRLRIWNAQTAAYLRARQIHPTQRFERTREGTVLRMTVRGTTELKNWVLSFGPYLEVLEPPSLRAEVEASLRAAAALYSQGRLREWE